MAIADDISVDINGNFRYTGSGTNYTVLNFIRYIQALTDDAEASGDDLLDITSSTPEDRSTDQILTLNSPYNIDDTLAQHLYDGSITQNDGDDTYSGYELVGTVVSGTEPMIMRDDKVLPAYWGTGINADAANLIIMRALIKSRSGGADIDGKRILSFARELNDQFAEFPTTLGDGVSVAAISTGDDLNNNSTDATIEGWTTIANVEGFQLIDIDGDGTDEEYYAQFDKGSQSLNDTYEWSKWNQQRSHIADNGTDVGSDFIVDNATITGQGQEFSARGQAEKLTEMRFQLKIGNGTPTGPLTAEVYDSDDLGTAAPTGAVLATSEEILASQITSSYAEVIFRFNDNVTLTASQEYFAVVRHANGDATNYFHVRGLATSGADDGNRAQDQAGWSGVAADDLWFTVKSSPLWHGRPGEKHRGITHEVVYDVESGGPFTEDEVLFWGSKITYDTDVGTFTEGEYVKIENAGVVVNGGKVLKDETVGNILTVALETVPGGLADGYNITGLDSGATADINTTITDQDKDGGEGVLLALDDNGTAGDCYIQLISGKVPVDNLEFEGRTSGSTANVNVTVTGRTISPEFIGQSTGTNIIGAYGIGFQPTDVGASDKLFDLTNTQRVPPNNVTFTVAGLVSGEDRILVGPRSAGVMQKDQMATDTTLNGAGETSISINPTPGIPGTAVPSTGNGADNTRLRVELDNGVYKRQGYTAVDVSTDTFTIPSTAYNVVNATSPANVFIAYIDVLADSTSEAFTAVHTSDQDLLIRVRDGGATPIKTVQASATFGSASQTVNINRVSDA